MWKLKLVFLLIIYFSGFATAIYYLAPNGRMDCKAAEYSYNSGSATQDSAANGSFKQFCEKTYTKAAAKIMDMKEQDFKDAFNRGMQSIKEMVKNSPNSNVRTADSNN